MPDPNDNVRNLLNEFASLDEPPGYAIFLKGPWGVGKTHFVKKWLASVERKKGSDGTVRNASVKPLYVSLYGLTSTSAIDQELYRELHPFLTSKAVTALKQAGKMLVKAAARIDIDDDGRDDVSFTIQLPSVDLLGTIKENKGSLLVFDDLERCQIEANVILGYINYLAEHGEQKVLLVGNETKMEEGPIGSRSSEESKSGDNKSKQPAGGLSFRLTKEKIIGRTLEIEPHFEGAIGSFIRSQGKSKAFVKENQSLVSEVFAISGAKNLRHLKFGLLEFDRLFGALGDEVRAKRDLCRRLLALLLTFVIEVRRGDLEVSDLTLLDPYARGLALRTPLWSDSKEKAGTISQLLKKYRSIPEVVPELPLLSVETWQSILGKGLICRETIDSELRQTSSFANERPQWVQLRDWLNLNDDQFMVLSEAVWKQYKEREFSVHFDEFLGVTRLLILLEKRELLGFLRNASVVQEACKYIDSLAESGFPETWLAGEALEKIPSLLLEPEGDSADFVRLLIDKLTQARKECLPGWTKELLY